MKEYSGDPIILEKLQRFSNRRKRLIALRGLYGALAVWLGTMISLAVVDRFVVMPDALRLAFSVAGHVGTVLVFWITCGRHLANLPESRELARLIELAAPELREELLSAVELAETPGDNKWDSQEFREAIQKTVATRISGISIEGLLTGKLISRWLYSMLAVILIFLMLACIPGMRFSQFFFRAVLAGANMERPSEILIKVVSPTPPDHLMPEGESVPVTVSISGGDVRQVVLEIFPKTAPYEKAVMTLSARNQFTAMIQLGREPVQYRIRAKDAITRKYMLDPRPSPQVVKFSKTYRYPAYSKIPPRTVTEVNGDLDALDGTEVELDIEINQPVREASLQVETGNTTTPYPIKCTNSNRINTKLPLTASGIYKVNLVASLTFFENKYSPKYEIRVRPDLIPSVKIDYPDQEQMVTTPDAVVTLNGTAKDDLQVTNVTQEIQVNRGAWKTVPLSKVCSNEVKVARTWDLFELGVHPGDQVLTKLVAIDLKGQRGESAPLRIRIANPGFDPKRLKEVEAKQEVNKALHELRQNEEELERRMNDAKNFAGNNAVDQLQKKQALMSAAVALENTQKQAEETLKKIKETLPQTRAPREAADLALVGSAISRINRESLPEVKEAIKQATENIAANDSKSAQEKLNQVNDPFYKGLNLARVADDANRQMLAAEEANLVSRDLQQLKEEQNALAEQIKSAGNDTNKAERILRRQSVATDETKSVEDQMKALEEHAAGGQEHAVRNHEKDLGKNRENLEKALAAAEAAPTIDALRQPSEQLQRSVENAANNMQNVKRNLAQQADKAREWLQNETGRPADLVGNLQRQLERDKQENKPAASSQDHIEAAAQQLKDRAALEEKRPAADAQFVADTAKVADALKALEQASNQPATNTIAAVKAIEENYRKLETGHDIAELAPALRQLAGQERWEKADAAEAANRARDWEWSKDKMKDLPGKMDQARLPQESVKSLREAANTKQAREVTNEMRKRESNPDRAENVVDPLYKMAGDMAQVKQQLQPAMEQARAEIDKAAPKLSERLDGLAKAAEKMEQATASEVEKAGKADNAEKVNREAAKLADAQAKLDNQIGDVKDALRRDANVQNLATEEGRARARDADDASAMLREQTPDANDLLQQAANTTQPEKQKGALKGAKDQQEKLADNLKKLADHYKNLETGKAEETRAALRDAEKETGLKTALDSEYTKAQVLESLAGKTPEAQLAELEKALQGNEPMRHELGEIAKDALGDAAAGMKESAEKEQKIAENLGNATKEQPKQQGTAAEQAKRIADKAQKLAKQEVPAIEKQSSQAGVNIKPELDRAAEALSKAAAEMPGDFAQPAEKIAAAMSAEGDKLQQAAGELNNAANKAGQPANDQQKAAQQHAQQAGQQAAELAKEAKQLASTLQEMHKAAEQQPAIEQAVREAGNDIERVGRHEARLGREFMGQRLQELGKQVESQTGGQIDKAEKALENGNAPAEAKPVAEGAKDAIQKPLDQLATAMKQLPPQVPVAAQQGTDSQLAAAPEEAAKWMARALDSLDAKLNQATAESAAGQQAKQQGQQAQQPDAQKHNQPLSQQGKSEQDSAAGQELARAVQSAAEAQATAMKDARGNDAVPGEKPLSANGGQGGKGTFKAPAALQGKMPEAVVIRGEWGKLPPKIAKDLLDSQREGVSGEYREMVNLYFRAIAEKAKAQKK